MTFSEFLNHADFATTKTFIQTNYPTFLKHIQLTFFNRDLLYSTSYTNNFIANLIEVFKFDLRKAEDFVGMLNTTIDIDKLGVKQTADVSKQNTESYKGYNVEGDYAKENNTSNTTFKTLDLPKAIERFGRMNVNSLYEDIDYEMGILFLSIGGL